MAEGTVTEVVGQAGELRQYYVLLGYFELGLLQGYGGEELLGEVRDAEGVFEPEDYEM